MNYRMYKIFTGINASGLPHSFHVKTTRHSKNFASTVKCHLSRLIKAKANWNQFLRKVNFIIFKYT